MIRQRVRRSSICDVVEPGVVSRELARVALSAAAAASASRSTAGAAAIATAFRLSPFAFFLRRLVLRARLERRLTHRLQRLHRVEPCLAEHLPDVFLRRRERVCVGRGGGSEQSVLLQVPERYTAAVIFMAKQDDNSDTQNKINV